MFRRAIWRVGELIFMGGSKPSAYVTVLARDASNNAIIISVTTSAQLPSAVAGYAYGCLAICADSGAYYYNSAGVTSCTFTAIGTVTSNSITTAMLQKSVVTPIKMGIMGYIDMATHIVTAGSYAPATADLISAYIKLDTQTQGFGLLLPAAATLLAAFTGQVVGSWFDFDVINSSGQTCTITGDTGTTIKGSTSLANGKLANIRIVVTGAATVDAIVNIFS